MISLRRLMVQEALELAGSDGVLELADGFGVPNHPRNTFYAMRYSQYEICFQ